MKTICRFLILSYLLIPNAALAHRGGLDSYQCHYCRTNCEEKYGIPTGDYHCHAGGDKSVYTPLPAPVDSVPTSDPDPTPIIESNTTSEGQVDNEVPIEHVNSPEIPSTPPVATSNTLEPSPVATTNSKPATQEAEEVVAEVNTEKLLEEEVSQEPVDYMPLVKEESTTPEEQMKSVLLGFLVLGVVGYGTYKGGKAGLKKVKKMLS